MKKGDKIKRLSKRQIEKKKKDSIILLKIIKVCLCCKMQLMIRPRSENYCWESFHKIRKALDEGATNCTQISICFLSESAMNGSEEEQRIISNTVREFSLQNVFLPH